MAHAPVEAVYADGFVLNEDEQGDMSMLGPDEEYDADKVYADGERHGNTMTDIIWQRPEAEHGPLVSLKCFVYTLNGPTTLEIDWTTVPKGARPIRFRTFQQDHPVGAAEPLPRRLVGVDFGYQWNDDEGKNQQDVVQLRL